MKEKLNQLKDYIINLQQENERLKENNMSYQEEMARTWKIADDYKSRIEKAVEYMNNTFNIRDVKDMFEIMNKLEDILNGRSVE